MNWNDVIGHDHLAQWFRRQILSDRLGHAYLFEGPEGVGKKQMALALAQAVNCAGGGADSCGSCDACRQITELQHAGLLLFQDLAAGCWVSRSTGIKWAGSEEALLQAYAALAEAGFIHRPVPDVIGQDRWDRIHLTLEKLSRRGGYLFPDRALDDLSDLGGDDICEAVRRVGMGLLRFPRSIVFFRQFLGIDLVTPRAHSEDLRTVQGFLSRKRAGGSRKIVIIDDAHKMTEEAQNCLLKTLEEPPEDSLLILILDQARDVLPTIRSRCQGVNFGVVPLAELAGALERRGFSREEAGWAARHSGGGFAAALSTRQEDFLAARSEMLHTWGEICKGDVGGLLSEVGLLAHEETSERSARVRRIREHLDHLTLWLRDLLLLARGAPPEFVANVDLRDKVEQESRRFSPSVLEQLFWIITRTGQLMDRNVDLRLALEGMVLELASSVKDQGRVASRGAR